MFKVPGRDAQTQRIRPLIQRPLRSRTVFVVTDAADVVEHIIAALEVDGYLVTTAEDGRDAITRLRTLSPPSLVIADLDLPERTGWHLVVAMSQDERLAAVPVVAISRSLRIDPYFRPVMSKPINLGALRDVVAVHCA